MTDILSRPQQIPATADIRDDDRAAVDTAELGELLLGRWAHVRRVARELAGRPELHKIEGLTHTEHRLRCFDQLHYLVGQKAVHRAFPKAFGGDGDNGGNIAGFEELVVADPRCRSRPACSGASSAPPSCTSAPSSTTRRGSRAS